MCVRPSDHHEAAVPAWTILSCSRGKQPLQTVQLHCELNLLFLTIAFRQSQRCKRCENMLKDFNSPSSVATLRASYGKCYGSVFNRGGIRRSRHFPCIFMASLKCPRAFRPRRLAQNGVPGRSARHFSYKFLRRITLLKCPCAFRLRRLAQKVEEYGIFPIKFHSKWLLWDCPCNPLVTLGLSDRTHWGTARILTLLVQPSRHFGPDRSRCGAVLMWIQGNLAQRSWQGRLL